MSRLGDYFTFLGLPRRLNVDMPLLEQRFRELSRQYHPDFFYNATQKERLESLERSSYLNDAYRTLKNPAARIEYLLGLEGLPVTKPGDGSPKVPPSLLEEVFALNEELDEIRELRESGGDRSMLRARLAAARKPIEQKRDVHERQLQELSARWDAQQDRDTLEALRERMLERNGRDLSNMRVVVSGSGNVAVYAVEKAQQLGATVVACSDSGGYVVDEKGIDLDLLKQVKEVERERISAYAERRSGAEFVEGGSVWDVPCEVALPSATQNELDADAAKTLVGNGVVAVAEGANMPTTPEAVKVFREAGVLFAPGKAANAGGVATSVLEMRQNARRTSWSFDHAESELAETMTGIHDRCEDAAARHGAKGDYVLGANVAGFEMVADAMLAQGLI